MHLSDHVQNNFNIENFAGNNSELDKPTSKERLNPKGSNRVLEPLFPPPGKSEMVNNNNL
jgi:hypothetical protein